MATDKRLLEVSGHGRFLVTRIGLHKTVGDIMSDAVASVSRLNAGRQEMAMVARQGYRRANYPTVMGKQRRGNPEGADTLGRVTLIDGDAEFFSASAMTRRRGDDPLATFDNGASVLLGDFDKRDFRQGISNPCKLLAL